MSVTLTAEQFASLISSISASNANQVVMNNLVSKNIIVEQSKADNMEDFLKSIKTLSVSKLANMNIVEFIVITIKENIDELEECQYPFVCVNTTKKTFYYRSENEWKKGSGFIKMLYNRIVKQAYMDIDKNYRQMYIDVEDDEINEKKYSESKQAEKQQILLNLCHIDKLSFEAVFEKVATKICKIVKTDFVPNK